MIILFNLVRVASCGASLDTDLDTGWSALTVSTLHKQEKEERVDEGVQRGEGPLTYDFIAPQFLSCKPGCHLSLYAIFFF